MPRPIYEIAHDIVGDWSMIGKGINYAAKPYLEVMLELNKITDNYFADSAKSVVLYFLSNATTYRGPTAKRLKAELKELLK